MGFSTLADTTAKYYSNGRANFALIWVRRRKGRSMAVLSVYTSLYLVSFTI